MDTQEVIKMLIMHIDNKAAVRQNRHTLSKQTFKKAFRDVDTLFCDLRKVSVTHTHTRTPLPSAVTSALSIVLIFVTALAAARR